MKKQGSVTMHSKHVKSVSKNTLFFIAFIEGMLVITVELLGAKMLIPLYGNSLIVWTSVLGISISFLALGYFAGGIRSQKADRVKNISLALAFASVFIAFMPLLAGILSEWLWGSSIYLGAVIAAVALLGPSLFFLGTTSPMIIQQLTGSKEDATAVVRRQSPVGKVYAISTAGGILFTLVCGFYVLPHWGIAMPVVIISLFLFASACYLHRDKKYIAFAICFVILLLKFFADHRSAGSPNAQTLYTSEGLLGQLKVVDIRDPNQGSFRYLFINGVPQSVIINNDESSLKGVSGWPYSHKVAMLSTLTGGGQRALLLGIGGGNVAKDLKQRQMKIDLVDLDERMLSVAKKYFYLDDEGTSFTCDDGRHFIRTTNKRYDLIVMDVFNAEVQPSYMFTRESFDELKEILNDRGMMIFNFGEHTKKEGVSAFRSVCNTLLATGFHVYYNVIESEKVDDILIIASASEIDLSLLKKENFTPCCAVQSWVDDFSKNPATKIEKPFDNGVILTDDKPMLDILNAETVRIWREWAINTFAAPGIKNKGRLFK